MHPMAIPYQLSALYQLIINTRTRQELPSESEFAKDLEEIEEKIILAFEIIRRQQLPEQDFHEFINDHYLSLLQYQDHLFKITGIHYNLLCNCISNLKAYMNANYSDILNTRIVKNKLLILPQKQLSIKDRLRKWFLTR